MSSNHVPAYKFNFGAGLSSLGRVDRSCTLSDHTSWDRILYRLNDLPLVAGIGCHLPSDLADLLDVSIAIYVSDRLALRETSGDERQPHDRWHRRLNLVIPVRDPSKWNQVEISEDLQDLLHFLTDDHWTFKFVLRRHDPRQVESQASLWPLPSAPASVILDSGGLDSFLGMASLLSARDVERIVPVSVIANKSILNSVNAVHTQLRRLSNESGLSIQPSRLHINICSAGRSRNDRESSHRARIMLFLAAGIAVSVLSGTDRLNVCENGIGALSLPMSTDHWGSRATKAMHPRTLALYSTIASSILQRPVSIRNIGLFSTKGELVRDHLNERTIPAARFTKSCDRASYLKIGHACGKCTSCILRRASLYAAGLSNAVDGSSIQYDTDFLDPSVRWDAGIALHLNAMRIQVERFRSALSPNPKFGNLLRSFPDLVSVMNHGISLGLANQDVEHELIRIFGSYITEFDAFVARIEHLRWKSLEVVPQLAGADGRAVAS